MLLPSEARQGAPQQELLAVNTDNPSILMKEAVRALAFAKGGDERSWRVDRVVTRRYSHLAWFRSTEGVDGDFLVKVPRLVGDSPARVAVKVDRLQTEFDTPMRLRANWPGDQGHAGVVPMTAHLSAIPALVMQEVRGRPILTLVDDEARWWPRTSQIEMLERACREAGKMLRIVHTCEPRPGELSVEELLEYVSIRLAALRELRASGMTIERQRRVMRALEIAAAQLSDNDRRLTGIHADYSLSNVVFDGERAVILDFSMFREGVPLYDVTRFCHQLALCNRKPAYMASTIRRLQKAFLAGYDPALETSAPLFRICMLQHVLSHWLGRVRAPVRHITERWYDAWVCRLHSAQVAQWADEQ
jgi:hypothetical protein